MKIRISTDKKHIPNNIKTNGFQYRNIKIGKRKIEFSSKFNELHSKVYKDFLKKKGIRAQDLKYLISSLSKFN